MLLVESSALFSVDPEPPTSWPPATLPANVARRLSGPDHGLSHLGALPPRALSLNVAQSCNLGCSYCYADEGEFGGSARRMSTDVAAPRSGPLDRRRPPG